MLTENDIVAGIFLYFSEKLIKERRIILCLVTELNVNLPCKFLLQCEDLGNLDIHFIGSHSVP